MSTWDDVSFGFDFSNFPRNKSISDKTAIQPKFKKTGTTIAAALFDGGVVVGADTRATAGPIVAVKNERKIHYIAQNIRACGAGTAADLECVADLCAAKLRLFQLNTGLQPRVVQAATWLVNKLFPYGGYIGAYYIVGGYDITGPSVIAVSPDGAVSQCPFSATGSGGYAALSVLEGKWRPNLSEEECKELVANSILAGITNDLGSGSNVNLAVIRQKETIELPNYRVTNQRNFALVEPVSAIEVEILNEKIRPLSLPEVHLEILDGGQEA
jgi:20S proteasome subunit beta 2